MMGFFSVPVYDVVVPVQGGEDGHFDSESPDQHERRRRDAAEDRPRWLYTVTAFGRSLRLNLTKRRDFLSPHLRVETRHEDGSITHSKVADHGTFLAGDVTSHPGSRVALSNDDGLVSCFDCRSEKLFKE